MKSKGISGEERGYHVANRDGWWYKNYIKHE